MRIQTIVYVTDMHRSVIWYGQLLDTAPALKSEHWTTFELDGGTLALHVHDKRLPAGSVELSLVAAGLESVAARINDAEAIVEQPFGRSFVCTDPDGTRIQVNEHQ